MDIIISNADERPIYEQVYSQIRAAIISGKLSEDELLPSIRSLAKDLRISVITAKRAYDELENDGFIYTVAAKGSYVAPKNTKLIREQHLREIEEHFRKIVSLSKPLSIEKDELLEIFDIIMKEENEDERH